MLESFCFVQVVEHALEDAGLCKEDIDWLVLHQANQRILNSAAQRLGVPSNRVVSNLAEYGNTSAASIPLALDEAVRSGSIQPGSTVRHGRPPMNVAASDIERLLQVNIDNILHYVVQIAIAGFGAGLTWAAAILTWS